MAVYTPSKYRQNTFFIDRTVEGTLDLFGVAKSLTERLFRIPELLDFECLQ